MPRTPRRRPRNPDLLAFGYRLRRLRQDAGLTQEKLAFKADLERSYVGQCERGERNVSLLNVVRLARAVNAKPSELLVGIDEQG